MSEILGQVHLGSIDLDELGSPIARGRSGEVYRTQTSDGLAVAVKIHDRAEAGHDEADRLRRVDHVGVVDLLEQGETDSGKVWLVLPWVEGGTLADALTSDAPFEIERARRIISQISDALDALHAAGIVHGDLSPNNILIDGNDTVTLIDLGASRTIETASIDETTGLDVTVTPRYASPEVARGERPTILSDQYAVGLIAYELFTGAFPFPEVATPIAMLAQHGTAEPVPASEHLPQLPSAVESALMTALSKTPKERYSSTVAFACAASVDGPAVEHRSTSPRGARPLAFGVCAIAVFAVILYLVTVFTGTAEPTNREIAGRAIGTSCNLLESPGFEAFLLPEGFYGADPSNSATRNADGGIDGTAALRLGDADQFGLFGEIVPIIAGREYMLSGFVSQQGDVEIMGVYIDYLNVDFQQLTAARDAIVEGEEIENGEGRRLTSRSTAPPDAAYAVPTFFKDGSTGYVLVDEVVFGLSEICPDLTS